jgi:hypothetical protein
VAVVDAQGRVSLRKVDIGRNYGETTELVAGAGTGDRLVLNPPDWIVDGQTVEVAPEAPAPGASKAAARKEPL